MRITNDNAELLWQNTYLMGQNKDKNLTLEKFLLNEQRVKMTTRTIALFGVLNIIVRIAITFIHGAVAL